MRKITIGCVADDFTGASDAASFLMANGVSTILTNGIPTSNIGFSDDVDAIVVALKSRTQETSQAVLDTIQSFEWLRSKGANILYFKYCSTFDSTAEGNIGPVIDAVIEKYHQPYAIICPTLLENKRIVKDGLLYVDGVLLADTHMKHHPLTPMWSSDIVELMRPQGKYPCYKISAEMLYNKTETYNLINTLKNKHQHFYLCVDFFEKAHGAAIMDLFSDNVFFTGGSGLIGELGKHYFGKDNCKTPPASTIGTSSKHGRLLLAGSCSVATVKQVEEFLRTGGKSILVYPEKLAAAESSIEEYWEYISANATEDILLYSSGSGGQLPTSANLDYSKLIEDTLAEIARRAVEHGWEKIVVAGGETSGAVTKALGYSEFYIGESVAPGVPIMTPTNNTKLRLVLKSGNFGGQDFFNTVLK